LLAKTVEPLSKPLPVTCRMSGPDPACTEGELREMTFTAPRMLKFSEFEVSVPSVNVTGTLFAVAISDAGTFAVTLVAVALSVVSGFPLKTICAPESTAVAFTVSGNSAPPTVANDGLSEVML